MPISSIGTAVNAIANAAAHAAQDVGPVAPEASQPEASEKRFRIINVRANAAAVGSGAGIAEPSPPPPPPPPPPPTRLEASPQSLSVPSDLSNYVPPGGLHPVTSGQASK